MRKFTLCAAALFTAGLLLGAYSFAAEMFIDPIEIKNYEGIAYISGGVGLDEREAIKAMGRNYSLKILLSVTSTELLTDVEVMIRDTKGAVVFKGVAEGPLMYANLHPGNYTVSASMAGTTLVKGVQLQPNRQAGIHFVWKGAP